MTPPRLDTEHQGLQYQVSSEESDAVTFEFKSTIRNTTTAAPSLSRFNGLIDPEKIFGSLAS